MQFRSSGFAGNDSRGPILIGLLLPSQLFLRERRWGTYDVAGELPLSSLEKRVKCTTRKAAVLRSSLGGKELMYKRKASR